MDPYGSVWIRMDPYGSVWIRMDPYGSVWTSIPGVTEEVRDVEQQHKHER
jgi:hypothetical protein